MKKINLEGKLKLNKETVSKLSNKEMSNLQGGWTGSIGLRCTQKDGDCSAIFTNLTKGWACNDSRATICTDSGCLQK